jgi:hypothetical protein
VKLRCRMCALAESALGGRESGGFGIESPS